MTPVLHVPMCRLVALASALALAVANEAKPATPKASSTEPTSTPTAQPVDEKAVGALIRLLGNDSLRVRQDATRRLVEMGEAIGPLLEATLSEKNSDPEVVLRVHNVLNTVFDNAWVFDANEAARRQDETAKTPGLTRELSLDLGNNLKMRLALIPAGEFKMGSPKSGEWTDDYDGPQHKVAITKPFYIGIYEVTQEQYEQVTGNNPSHFKGKTNPVEQITWHDGVDFCKRLSQKAGKSVRFPTEAEWEYACRAGTQTCFSFGDDDGNLTDHGWCGQYSENKAHPVGQKRPNPWGLYDMHGNVAEWCSDWFEKSYANAKHVDPQGPSSGSVRVLRGGHWDVVTSGCGSASRFWDAPDYRGVDRGNGQPRGSFPPNTPGIYGFRVVVVPDLGRK